MPGVFDYIKIRHCEERSNPLYTGRVMQIVERSIAAEAVTFP